jgi:hypothetical protein
LTASIGGIGLWLAQRVLGKAAFQTAMNDGFSKLNDKLQVEMERREKEIAAERSRRAPGLCSRPHRLLAERSQFNLIQPLKA